MKKLILAVLILLQLSFVNAQKDNSKPNNPPSTATPTASTPNTNTPPAVNSVAQPPFLKQKKEEITFEGILQLQIMDQPLGLIFNELKVRYFKTEKRAYRARGIVSMSNNNVTINGTNGKNATVIEAIQHLNLGVGFEDHFKSKNNISPYWGAEILVGLSAVKLDGLNTRDGKTFEGDYKLKSENTEVSFYLGGIAGIDYYLSSNFYIGTEIRYGYQSTNLGNVSRTVTDPNGTSSNSGASLGTNTKLEMNYTPGVRFGYKF